MQSLLVVVLKKIASWGLRFGINVWCAQGGSGVGMRVNGVPTTFSRFALKCLVFGCVPTPFLLALHP